MAGTFFRASPVGRRGGFRLVVDRLYGAKDDEASSGIEFSGEVLRRALLNIYSKDFHPATEIEVNLFGEIWAQMNNAAKEGFRASKAADPDEDFRDAILRNNAVFSAFKVHRMQNDMARRLLDSDGNLKPFEQWRKEVMPIASHQVGNWLRTEYDTAVLRAHQAADWRQFEREKDILPNLRWMPSNFRRGGFVDGGCTRGPRPAALFRRDGRRRQLRHAAFRASPPVRLHQVRAIFLFIMWLDSVVLQKSGSLCAYGGSKKCGPLHSDPHSLVF